MQDALKKFMACQSWFIEDYDKEELARAILVPINSIEGVQVDQVEVGVFFIDSVERR